MHGVLLRTRSGCHGRWRIPNHLEPCVHPLNRYRRRGFVGEHQS